MTKGRFTGGKPPLVKGQEGASPVIAFRVPQAVKAELHEVAAATGTAWAAIARAGVAREVARLKKSLSAAGAAETRQRRLPMQKRPLTATLDPPTSPARRR